MVASELRADSDGSAKSAEDRQAVLRKLSEIVQQWVREQAAALKVADPEAAASAARVAPYGSSTLCGVAEFVQDSSTDLDVLCIVPNILTRDAHFFGVAAELDPPCLAARLANAGTVVLLPPPSHFGRRLNRDGDRVSAE